MSKEMEEFVAVTVLEIYEKVGHQLLLNKKAEFSLFVESLSKSMETKYGGKWECITGIENKFDYRIPATSSCFIELTIANFQIVLLKSQEGWFS